ncbi:MAG: hypothetical protein M3Y69_02835 [Verrucomicrobiota bacterium]|nr:hypothetical protein [Verrucomicrobiota bacterium]
MEADITRTPATQARLFSRYALVFEEWQDANGLRVAKRGSSYNWKSESIEGEPLGVMEFANVCFSEKSLDAEQFK